MHEVLVRIDPTVVATPEVTVENGDTPAAPTTETTDPYDTGYTPENFPDGP